MSEKPVIFLDMDGVCTNFFKRVLEAFDKPYPPQVWPTDLSQAHAYFNLSLNDFWVTLQKKDPQFWAEIEPYPWFKSFYDGLNELAQVYYLTSPTLDPNCMHGKLTWMQKQHDLHFRNYIITSHKHFVAKPHHILIDDTPEKIEKFRKHGGKGVLFQQPWNTSNAPENPDLVAIEDVKKLLNEL